MSKFARCTVLELTAVLLASSCSVGPPPGSLRVGSEFVSADGTACLLFPAFRAGTADPVPCPDRASAHGRGDPTGGVAFNEPRFVIEDRLLDLSEQLYASLGDAIVSSRINWETGRLRLTMTDAVAAEAARAKGAEVQVMDPTDARRLASALEALNQGPGVAGSSWFVDFEENEISMMLPMLDERALRFIGIAQRAGVRVRVVVGTISQLGALHLPSRHRADPRSLERRRSALVRRRGPRAPSRTAGRRHPNAVALGHASRTHTRHLLVLASEAFFRV